MRGRNVIGASFTTIKTLAPQMPNSFREMEPLFSAVICGCNAGLFREALHEFTFPGFSEGMPALRLTLVEREGRCFLFWFISSNMDAGDHSLQQPSRGRVSLRKISSSFSCRRRHT